MRKKTVYQYDMDGRYIRSYKSTLEAERITGVKHIYAVASGKKRSAGGFLWRYYKQPQISGRRNGKDGKVVYFYDRQKGGVERYGSIKESATSKKMCYRTIATALKDTGHYATSYGVFSFRRLTKQEIAKRVPQNTQKREVEQRRDGVLLAVYPSVREASRRTGITPTAIYNVASPTSPNKTARGFTWAYR